MCDQVDDADREAHSEAGHRNVTETPMSAIVDDQLLAWPVLHSGTFAAFAIRRRTGWAPESVEDAITGHV